MSEKNKQNAIQFIHALAAADEATIRAVSSEKMEAIAMGSSCLSGARNLEEIVAGIKLFPQVTKNGLRFDVISATAEGDRVSLELEGHSELVTGVPYNNVYHMLVIFEGDKIVRMKEYFDTKLVDETIGPLFAG